MLQNVVIDRVQVGAVSRPQIRSGLNGLAGAVVLRVILLEYGR